MYICVCVCMYVCIYVCMLALVRAHISDSNEMQFKASIGSNGF